MLSAWWWHEGKTDITRSLSQRLALSNRVRRCDENLDTLTRMKCCTGAGRRLRPSNRFPRRSARAHCSCLSNERLGWGYDIENILSQQDYEVLRLRQVPSVLAIPSKAHFIGASLIYEQEAIFCGDVVKQIFKGCVFIETGSPPVGNVVGIFPG